MSISTLFPIIAAVLYGLSYALYPMFAKQMSFVTYMLVSSAVSTAVFFSVACFMNGGNDLAAVKTLGAQQWLWVLGFGLLGWAAWYFTLKAADELTPTYAAIGEISYVLFVPLFSWLLFRDQHLDRYTAVAAVLILAGSFILLYGKTSSDKQEVLEAGLTPVTIAQETHHADL